MSASLDPYPLPPAASLGESCEAAAQQLLSDILLFHVAIVRSTGGVPSLLSPALLDSAVHRPFYLFGDEFMYQTGLEQAALLHSLVLNHVFEDGNKRTALTSCLFFLERCGYWHYVAMLSEKEAHALEALTLAIASERATSQRAVASVYDVTHITGELDAILSPSRKRRPRVSRLFSGAFRLVGQLFVTGKSFS